MNRKTKKYSLIALMGMGGAMSRYIIGLSMPEGLFPYGTLFVNGVGCFLLPVVFILLRECTGLSESWIGALGSGFVGAFTTFSSFSVEVVQLMYRGQMGSAVLYGMTSLLGGLLCAWVSVTWCNHWVAQYRTGKMEKDVGVSRSEKEES